MQSLAILLTVFNRKDKTLSCLNRIHAQTNLEMFIIDIYLTNDGCTDGTPEAIKELYPKTNIITGSGDLFWNRGMHIAWKYAANNKDYDFYLWLNDDTIIINTAISKLLEYCKSTENKAIIVCPTKDKKKDTTSYSGYKQGIKREPNGHLQKCDSFNGNCVLIPKIVFLNVGNLDWKFRHAIGDLEYGFRAQKKGFEIFLAPYHLAFCENNPKPPLWCQKDIPIRKRISNLYSPLGYAEPIPFFYFELKNYGVITAIKHFLSIHLRVIFPSLWN